MHRSGRTFAVLLLAGAGAAAAHLIAYAIAYECWLCTASDVDAAAHGSASNSIAPAIAVASVIAALAGRRFAREGGFRVTLPLLLSIQLPAFVGFELLERQLSVASTFADHAVLLGLGLQLVTGLLFARFARVVAVIVRSLRGGPVRRSMRAAEPIQMPRRGVRRRATVWNVTGFLRAPPHLAA
jgi:hypothetical protein